jgi:radical SAM protein with 4Fe4S-binding SPASM domain
MFKNNLVPRAAVLELTYRCNHTCLFCSVPWSSPRGDYGCKSELSVDEWKSCIDELTQKGVRTFALSGGEPLLKEGFREIFCHASSRLVEEPEFDESGKFVSMRRRPAKVSVITNGASINSAWINFFVQHQPLLTVSLPGLSEYGYLTGGGKVERALEAINAFFNAGLTVTVAICVTKRNLPELFETIASGFLNGARQLLLNRFLPGGRGIGYPELCLTKDEIQRMLDIAEEVCQAANIQGSVGTELPLCLLEKEYKKVRVGTVCSGGVDFFAVDPSGYVRPCNHSPVRQGTWRDLTQSLENDYWQRFKTKTFLPQMCHECAKSFQCDGGCREAAHIVGGALDSPDPVFC